ncbi:3-dehydroquinate synthase [Weissella hellenica]|uniref:3-dehydroquinate synthase n=1 Tax=Weissella hellenica TaxID=46256 RepID=UPI00388ADE35
MITVSLPNKIYQIKIANGLREQIGAQIQGVWSQRQILIMTDEQVGHYYLAETCAQLEAVGYQVTTLVLPGGEQTKTLPYLEQAITMLADNHFTRDDGIIALGGGVIGDLAGLTAATYMRGIGFIQLATSLTAQVDSSVGGKTAINLGQTKNIMGTFYQPDLVLIDPSYLKTLANRDLVEGYAEVVKTSALAGGVFWELTGKIQSTVDILENALTLITQSVQYKAGIVIQDEQEAGIRKYLNFGHTIGHAIELLAHGKLRHGEAVSIGMIAITQRFVQADISTVKFLDDLRHRLTVVGLPIDSPLVQNSNMLHQLVHDKKNHAGVLQLVAIKTPGEPLIIPKALTDMNKFMQGA